MLNRVILVAYNTMNELHLKLMLHTFSKILNLRPTAISVIEEHSHRMKKLTLNVAPYFI